MKNFSNLVTIGSILNRPVKKRTKRRAGHAAKVRCDELIMWRVEPERTEVD